MIKELPDAEERKSTKCGNLKDHANLLFKQVYETKNLRGRSNDAVSTACLYMACRQEGVPRTFKATEYHMNAYILAYLFDFSRDLEVCAVSRVSKKEIGKVFKKILKILETNVQSVTVEDFMSRFCGNLNLNIAVQRVANVVARRALNLNLVAGRSPVSVAAAAIYMAACALGYQKEKREIGEVAGCAEATITCAYRAMHARASELFPEDVRLSIRPLPL
ncbi:transcription factor TFIIB repeat-containing domain protein [Opisthorchis viverrini]|uniref:Transcription initiation factor IIB n=1 Tax=Opisthorchis viverrini TaxID=6198 RepID=A0A1S8WWR2_OPIVI|nr:transcription factor TFIIB repeat-containing domain protein [Opisthorchis viverrini]